MCIEVRSIIFLPLLCSGDSENYVLGGVKYFLSQTPPALIVLISLIVLPSLLYEIFVLALFFKIGVPPFHGWVIRIISNINTARLGILLTLIKFLPLLILSSISRFATILNLSIVVFVFFLFSNIGNIINIIIIMIISSIGNSYWAVSGLIGSGPWIEFIIIYRLLTVFMFLIINNIRIHRITELLFYPLRFKTIIILYLMCVGGIPPIVIFFVKLIIIKSILIYIYSIIILLGVGGILLIFYMNLRFNILLTSSLSKPSCMKTYRIPCFVMGYLTSPGLRSLILT